MNFIDKRIKRFYNIIDKVVLEHNKPYIACSWGKDSIILVNLILKRYPCIPVVFMNSGYALTDIYNFRDYYLNTYNIQHYVELKCNTNYIKLCTQYGLPTIDRKQSDHEKVKKIIKKDTIDEWANKNEYDCCIWGIRAQETAGRKKFLRRYGLIFNTPKITKCSPIGWWKNTDVWNVIDYCNIPYSDIYDKVLEPNFTRDNIKNGGWLTTDKATEGRVLWLKHFYPQDYNKLENLFPEVKNYV